MKEKDKTFHNFNGLLFNKNNELWNKKEEKGEIKPKKDKG